MAEVLGHNAYIGLGREAVHGEAATITDWIRIVSQGIKRNVPYTPRDSLGDPERIGVVPGTKSGEGPIVVEWLYENLELLLEYFFGTANIQPDTPVVDTYTWTWRPNYGIYLNKGLTVETSFGMPAQGGWSYIWDGGKCDTIAFSHERDKVLRFTGGFSFQGYAYDASPSVPTYPTDLPVMPDEFVFEVDDTPTTNVSGWSFSGNNSLSKDRAKLGTGEILEQLRGNFVEFTGTWTGDFTSNVLKAIMESGTDVKLEFIYTTSYYITGTTPYSLQFTFPKAYIVGESPGVDNPGVVPETCNFFAIRDPALGYAMEVKAISGRDALPTES